MVCRHFRKFMPEVKNVLVLGTGLGSMVQVMIRKGYDPEFTLVEKDKLILKWAMEFAPEGMKAQPVCEDAHTYMMGNMTHYDLVFIDIFNGRHVPRFVYSESFLTMCRDSLAPGSHLAFNYMVNDWQEWQTVQRIFGLVFPGYQVLERGENRVLVV
jgi:spermidine synthase